MLVLRIKAILVQLGLMELSLYSTGQMCVASWPLLFQANCLEQRRRDQQACKRNLERGWRGLTHPFPLRWEMNLDQENLDEEVLLGEVKSKRLFSFGWRALKMLTWFHLPPWCLGSTQSAW